MKTRTRLVSNSSSSSFIVKTAPNSIDEILLESNPSAEQIKQSILTQEEAKTCWEYGFRPCKEQHASEIELSTPLDNGYPPIDQGIPAEEVTHLSYSVTCNQDEVIEFLTSKGIPFAGSCHYGHYNVFYERGADHWVEIENPGLSAEMYGIQSDGEIKCGWRKCYREVDINENKATAYQQQFKF